MSCAATEEPVKIPKVCLKEQVHAIQIQKIVTFKMCLLIIRARLLSEE